MDKAKHTPGHTVGPWHVENAGRIYSGDMTLIATSAFLRNPGEEAANARLIAAAPEMLDALRRAVLALAFAAETSQAMQDDYNAVSAAIAKATGA